MRTHDCLPACQEVLGVTRCVLIVRYVNAGPCLSLRHFLNNKTDVLLSITLRSAYDICGTCLCPDQFIGTLEAVRKCQGNRPLYKGLGWSRPLLLLSKC